MRYEKDTGKRRCCGKIFSEAEFKKHIDEKHEGHDWYGWKVTAGWSFVVEPKIYLSSNHASKISIDSEEIRKKVLKWIDKSMAEAGIKPVPRFSLANHVKP